MKQKERVKRELHLEYRPQNFEELIGNDALKKAVLSVIDRAHVYLFHGQRGCGKTTLARLIAAYWKIDRMDIHEIDAADKTSVDDTRKIKESVHYAPQIGKKKIYIIDEVHRLSPNAMDSLLKTLEDTPEHCIFVLCTTDLDKVSVTIKSRAKVYEVSPLTEIEAVDLIDWICDEEGIELSPDICQAIIETCDGIPREIVVTLDKVRDLKANEALQVIQSSKSDPKVMDLCRALLKRNAWADVAVILKDLKDDPEKIRYAVLGYMNAVLLNGNNKQAAFVIGIFRDSFINSKRPGLTLACWESVS
jgi:DNA polymerase III subunit gamma/tau